MTISIFEVQKIEERLLKSQKDEIVVAALQARAMRMLGEALHDGSYDSNPFWGMANALHAIADR
jgi:hypothetical protein